MRLIHLPTEAGALTVQALDSYKPADAIALVVEAPVGAKVNLGAADARRLAAALTLAADVADASDSAYDAAGDRARP